MQHPKYHFPRLIAICLAIVVPQQAYALGLGELTVHSRLFAPLAAVIELHGVEASNLNQLSARFGSQDEYLSVGKQRPGFLSQVALNAGVGKNGATVIHVTSVRSVHEPVLDLVVFITSPKGQIQRAYNLLLDPPLWIEGDKASVEAAAPKIAPLLESDPVQAQPVEDDSLPTTRSQLIDAGLINGADYGPVRDGDRISLIAERTRFDRSVTINQMMMAYVRLNPHAFERANLNGLRQGEIL
ncbi:MAG: FimV/HubP family polar landmark protein, partial [Pseudomonadota bacterium]